jgi:hypothetical protein
MLSSIILRDLACLTALWSKECSIQNAGKLRNINFSKNRRPAVHSPKAVAVLTLASITVALSSPLASIKRGVKAI